MQRLRVKQNALPRFVWYLLNGEVGRRQLDYLSDTTTGLANLSGKIIGRVALTFPSVPEQTAIVRFLDHADRRIRRYIRAKEKLIALLGEQKQAIIHQAVTGRIDVRTGQPYPAYKPSGVEWLGDVPAHWELRRLNALSRGMKNGSTPPTEDIDYYAEDGLPWYGPPSIDKEFLSVGQPTRFLSDRAIEEGKARIISPPALAVSVIGNVGRSALLTNPGATNQQITCFELINNVCDPHFLVMQFRFAEKSLIASSSSATIRILDSTVLKSTRLALPPLAEQSAIVRFLEAATANVVAAITHTSRHINLLREYRPRLIADVVTGKLDVREAAAALPEVDPLVDDDEEGNDLGADETPAFDDDQEPVEVAG